MDSVTTLKIARAADSASTGSPLSMSRRFDMPRLSHGESEAVQQWSARRTWQIRWPIVGRRSYDQHVPFAGDLEKYIRWQIQQEPWRRDGRV